MSRVLADEQYVCLPGQGPNNLTDCHSKLTDRTRIAVDRRGSRYLVRVWLLFASSLFSSEHHPEVCELGRRVAVALKASLGDGAVTYDPELSNCRPDGTYGRVE